MLLKLPSRRHCERFENLCYCFESFVSFCLKEEKGLSGYLITEHSSCKVLWVDWKKKKKELCFVNGVFLLFKERSVNSQAYNRAFILTLENLRKRERRCYNLPRVCFVYRKTRINISTHLNVSSSANLIQ